MNVLLAWRLFWVLPCSLVGAMLGLVLLCAGASARRVDRTFEIAWNDGQAPRWVRHFKFDAITLGHVILGVSHNTLAKWRSHERVHVHQYERWGVVFFLAYPASSLLAWLRGDCVYRGNWFERQAYAQACEKSGD